MIKMKLDDKALAKMNKDRLFDLMYYHSLPISQAVVVHLCCDLNWKMSDVADLVEVQYAAIADAKRKGLDKLKR